MDKLEQLKKIADEVDAKLTPLLDQQQQQKFQAIREQHRRQLIEKLASQIKQKVETEVRKVVPDLVHKLEGLDSELP
jgi:hypothetical protein